MKLNPTYAEKERRRRLLMDWLRVHGPYCPGYGRPAHMVPLKELTADHLIPRAFGGENGPLTVLCRSCNSRRGTRKW